MAWIDDRFWAHRKVVGLSDRSFRAYVNGVCYASGMGTRGHLDEAQLALIGAKKREKTELISRGLWHENGVGIVINDWEEHNEKRDKRKAADRERKRLARAAEREKEAAASAGRSADNPPDSPQDTDESVRRTGSGRSAENPAAERVKSDVLQEQPPQTPPRGGASRGSRRRSRTATPPEPFSIAARWTKWIDTITRLHDLDPNADTPTPEDMLQEINYWRTLPNANNDLTNEQALEQWRNAHTPAEPVAAHNPADDIPF